MTKNIAIMLYKTGARNIGLSEISDIAFRSGFTDVPYFNRLFRKLFGMTPTDYRYEKTADKTLLKPED